MTTSDPTQDPAQGTQEPQDPTENAAEGTVKRIADGVYVVKNASRSQKFALADPSGKTAKNVQMRVYKRSSSNAQRFYIRNEGGGFVSLQVVASGLYLADSNGKVVQLGQSSAKDRLWKPIWKGGYAFANAKTGKLISLAGGTAKARAKVVTATDAKSTAQRWKLSKTSLLAGGYYQLRSGVGTYLDVAGMSYAYGSNIQAHAHNKTGAQMFHLSKRSKGYYRIVNAQSFLAVGVKGASKARKANVVQAKVSNAASQLWKPVLKRSGGIVFKNKKSGKVLEVAGSSKKSGANVRQNAAGSGKGQLWRLKKVKKYSLSGNSTLDHHIANVLRTHGSLASAFNWTVHHSYRNGQRYWSNPHVLPDSRTIALANDFFSHGSGNCYRFACAFSWLARGLGYKTNVISGWVASVGGGQAPHGWVEVYSGGTHVCDPDLAHEIPGHNWFMCTYATSPTAYHSW